MFGKYTSNRNRHKMQCDECHETFTRRDLRRAQRKHRDTRTGLIVLNQNCPNCGHLMSSYYNEEVNARHNTYGVGWSPPGS